MDDVHFLRTEDAPRSAVGSDITGEGSHFRACWRQESWGRSTQAVGHTLFGQCSHLGILVP